MCEQVPPAVYSFLFLSDIFFDPPATSDHASHSMLESSGDVDLDPVSLADVVKRCKKGNVFCHLNVRSLSQCVDEIHDLIAPIGDGSLFLSLSETWLDSSCPDGVVSIPGYRIFRRDRRGRGGGVAIFCPDGSRCRRREDLECNDLEALWIELGSSKKRPLLVCTIYRPPDAGCHFLISSQSCLRLLTRNVRRSWLWVILTLTIDRTVLVRSACNPLAMRVV